MAQPGTCLPHKNEGLSLDLQHTRKSQMWWHTYVTPVLGKQSSSLASQTS